MGSIKPQDDDQQQRRIADRLWATRCSMAKAFATLHEHGYRPFGRMGPIEYHRDERTSYSHVEAWVPTHRHEQRWGLHGVHFHDALSSHVARVGCLALVEQACLFQTHWRIHQRQR